MKTISLKVPDSLDRRLGAAAQRRGASKSAVAREAIELFCAQEPGEALSCYDLAADLAGIVSGPPDLSTNPEYLEGFGE